MFENIFPETQLVSKYYGEYLQYIHNYQNFHRPAIFCRYIRINKAASSYNTEALVTESKYLSGIKFDILGLIN